MDQQRKWAGAIIIGLAVLLVGSVLVINSHADQSILPKETQQPQTIPGQTANASAIGYAGPVLVRLTLGETGVVQAIDIGGARFMETNGLGSRVREQDFTSQFLGATPPFVLGENIDAVSGATLSSQAAVDAANDAAAFWAQ